MTIKKNKYNLINDGFCFLPKIFSDEETLNARIGLWDVINCKYETGRKPENRFWEPGDNPNSIIKIDKPHICNKSVWDLVTNKTFGRILAKETDAKSIQIWHSQVVWKPHSKGEKGNAGWHRDSQYWPFWTNEGLFTAWIALSNVSSKSGPVRFICGSNHWDNVEGMDFFNQNIDSQNKTLNRIHKNKKIASALLKTGEISIHSSQTYHSSIGNKENDPRIGMVVHFCTDKAKRIKTKGENATYLDQIKNPSIAPMIYES